MSAGYASRLSEYNNKGICGLPEKKETARSLTVKTNQLVDLVRNAKHVVLLTGAGISTSAGIPDFRGPKGIWTLEEKQRKRKERLEAVARKRNRSAEAKAKTELLEQVVGNSGTTNVRNSKDDDNACEGASKRQKTDKEGPRGPVPSSLPVSTTTTTITTSPTPTVASGPKMDFTDAKPTKTHRAICKLVELGYVQFVVTQNVDGLHKKSGLSRDHHAVLHGCVFTETCEKCETEHFRDFDVGGMSFQRTGRKCETNNGCDGHLVDSLLDWEDELPEFDFDRAVYHSEKADLAIALGTSLRIEPAGGLPARANKFAIVNLQVTPYDGQSKLIIRAPVDGVMDELLKRLGHPDWDQDEGKNVQIERLWKRPKPFL